MEQFLNQIPDNLWEQLVTFGLEDDEGYHQFLDQNDFSSEVSYYPVKSYIQETLGHEKLIELFVLENKILFEEIVTIDESIKRLTKSNVDPFVYYQLSNRFVDDLILPISEQFNELISYLIDETSQESVL